MAPREIHELDPQTVERIAAGEVVERPASAVKELLENSIDADASRVSVAVEAGGTEGIVVTDDGVGMDETTLRRAVEEHTTSKLTDIDDLEAGVSTLGFRGEALHAIGAVSRLTVTSRPRDAVKGSEDGDGTERSHGSQLTVEGGTVTDISPAGCPPGTTVEVEDLFYNVPARRKYLKQDSTEFAHVSRVVTNYALANPDVAISLEHDGRETFATPGSGDLQAAVLSVYGREVAEAMSPVSADLPDGPLTDVSGLLSHPETTRSSSEYLSTFVNGRYVTAETVREAILDAYGSQTAPGRYPFAVLFLQVDPAAVDVNVHPRKLEVRFANREGVRRQVQSAVEQSLLDAGLLRTSAPRGRSAPEQATIEPGQGEKEEEGASGATASAVSSRSASETPTTATDPVAPDRTRDDDSVAADSAVGDGAGETTDGTAADSRDTSDSDATGGPSSDASSATNRTGPRAGGETLHTSTADADSASVTPADSPSATITGSGTQRTLDGEEATPERAYETLPDMRVLGQFDDTYVVAETDDGLVLLDQHAADERVNYERLKERFAGDTTTQTLADPVELDLTAREAELFEAATDALARLGFSARLAGDRTVAVTTVPGFVADAAEPTVIRDVLADLLTSEDAAESTVEAIADDIVSDMACYPSITGNTSLTEGSVLDLLAALDACENPWACPHGRPVLVHVDAAEIEERFERDYPGHQ